MNKKLRLLVTDKCEHNCSMCCNRQFEFQKIPVVDRWDYDEIMITGGNPLLHQPWLRISQRTINLVKTIRKVQNVESKIYIYTNTCDVKVLGKIALYVDGFVLTPHNYRELQDIMVLNKLFVDLVWPLKLSMRVNLFEEQENQLPEGFVWNKNIILKQMQWIPDCPIPEGEDFRRLANLF